VLSFSEVKDITDNFKHQIGPKMFKGTLPNNQPVAIKDLKANIEERKFRSVVSKIGSIHHKNLVRLEGYCCESSHRFLVYEETWQDVGGFIRNDKMTPCFTNHLLSQLSR